MAKRSGPRFTPEEAQLLVSAPNSHFIDSGSFSLWSRAEEYGKQHNCGEWGYYDTDDFYKYIEDYAAFVKKYAIGIDYCANVDVLPFRDKSVPPAGKDSYSLSYRNLKLLEDLGIQPVPVVHYPGVPTSPTMLDTKQVINTWLRRYVEEGYRFIGIGGLVGSTMKSNCIDFIDRCFDFVTTDGKLMVDFHGFGVTAHELLLRYPWATVDSTSWTKKGGFGIIIVPKHRKDHFIFVPDDLAKVGRADASGSFRLDECIPWSIIVSEQNKSARKVPGCHYLDMPKAAQRKTDIWLASLGVAMGTVGGDWDGVITDHNQRRIVNLLFYERLIKKLPTRSKRTWNRSAPKGLGLTSIAAPSQPATTIGPPKPDERRLVIYYSGCASIPSQPEVVLGKDANIMLTFYDFHKKQRPDARMKRVLKARKIELRKQNASQSN